jgi:hypothetical protein
VDLEIFVKKATLIFHTSLHTFGTSNCCKTRKGLAISVALMFPEKNPKA